MLNAAYLISRTPTKVLKFQKFGVQPSYDYLRVFGYLCYAHEHNRIKDKFDARSSRCIFLGYPHGEKG